MKTTKLKARRMWANPLNLKDDGHSKLLLTRKRGLREAFQTSIPVAVIPLDDVKALVDRAVECDCNFPSHRGFRKDFAVSVLQATGVLPKPRKGRK